MSAGKNSKRGSELMDMIKYVGWRYRANANQIIVYPPDGSSLSMGLNTGDYHGNRNAEARLRRAGLFEAVRAKRQAEDDAARAKVRQQRAAAQAQIDAINQSAISAEGEEDPMARRDQVLFDLVDRCEKVNWKIRRIGVTGSHILVTPTGTNRPITIATGSSVNEYPKQILSKLTRAGLLDAEEKMRQQDEKDRRQRIDDDRAQVPEIVTDQQDGADEIVDAELGELDRTGPAPGGLTEVGGVAIAEWDHARTPIGATDKKTIELLLQDGTLHYACLLGDFVGGTWQSVTKHRKAAHPEMASAAAKRRAEIAAEKLAAVPQPQEPEPAAQPEPVSVPVAPPAVAPQRLTAVPALPERPPAPQVAFSGHPGAVEPKRVEALPPAARAGIASVAAAARTAPQPVARTSAQPAARASSAPPAPMDLPAMLARMRELASADADRTRLIQALSAAEKRNEVLQQELAAVRRQGQRLADECITKDAEITRLRKQAETDAAVVAAAGELQQLMATLMTGGTVNQVDAA